MHVRGTFRAFKGSILGIDLGAVWPSAAAILGEQERTISDGHAASFVSLAAPAYGPWGVYLDDARPQPGVQVSELVCEEFSYVLLVTLVLVGGDDERAKTSHSPTFPCSVGND